MSVRVLSGKFKGMELKIPDKSRATLTRARTTLFDSLYSFDKDFFTNKVILDAFAGSGAFGIEALSRGASLAYFLDNDLGAIKVIRDNLQFISNTMYVLKKCNTHKIFLSMAPVNIIFLDPPFGKFSFDFLIENFFKKNWADEKTFFIIEQDSTQYVDFYGVSTVKKIPAGRIVFYLCNSHL